MEVPFSQSPEESAQSISKTHIAESEDHSVLIPDQPVPPLSLHHISRGNYDPEVPSPDRGKITLHECDTCLLTVSLHS